MAATLNAKFELIDQMSNKLSNIAEKGQSMIAGWQSATGVVSNAMSSFDSSASSAVTTVDGVAHSIEQVSDSCEETGQAYMGLADAQEEAERATRYYNAIMDSGSDDLEEMEYATQRLQNAIENLEQAQEQASDATRGLGEASGDASFEMDHLCESGADAMQTISDALAAAGIVAAVNEIGQAFLDAAASAETFETSIAQLQTIAGDASIDTLTNDIGNLSNETGISADSLANVAYNAISAGSAVEDAVSTAEAASKLATAGFTDTTSALSVLSTAMNSYGDAAGTATDISNSLIMVQNLGVTTVAELSQQMGKAIATASGYNVSLGNLESGYVSLTKSGIATAESTTYINAMLNELGSSSSEVSGIIQEATGQTFGQLMRDGWSLADVLEILYEDVNGDAEAMMNLWGSAQAGQAANAIVNQGLETFNDNLEAITSSAGATQEAYSIMADTTAYAHQKMTNAMNNLQIAIGDGINPALEKLYNAGTEALTAMGNFATEHPVVVKAASAIAVGIGAVTTGVVAFTTATKVAIPAIVNLGTAVNGALGPIGWIAAGVTAVTVALGAYSLMMEKTEDETLEMTSTTKAQYEELEELERRYQEACDTFGETSDEASALRYDMEQLEDEFASNGKTIAEFADEAENAHESYLSMIDGFEKNNSALKDNELENLALISKLQQLASETDNTAGSQEAMKAIIDELNNSVEGLNLTYDDFISNQEEATEKIKKMAEAQAEQERRQEQYEEYVELLKQQAEKEKLLAEATDEATASEERKNKAWAAYNSKYGAKDYGNIAVAHSAEAKEANAASEAWRVATSNLETYEGDLADINGRIAEIEESWNGVKTAIDADGMISDAEAVSEAYGKVQTQIEELAKAYDEAYDAARESFEGQFSLFETADMKSDDYLNSTVANAQKAMESQLAYWEEYSANIEALKALSADDLGITQTNYDLLMSYVQDGSVEAAGLAASMVDNIQKGNADAVAKLGNTIADVQTKQIEIAASTADWVTDYSDQLDEFSKEMADTIDELELSDEAESAAKSTIESYTEQLKASGADAVGVAKDIANQVASALSSGGTTATVSASEIGYTIGAVNSSPDSKGIEELTIPEVSEHANGTLEGEDYYIAGENGPELIIGKPDSTVFPHSETEKIISALNNSTTYSDTEYLSNYYSNEHTYDTDYTYDMSNANTFGDSSLDNTVNYDTDYMYDTSNETLVGDTISDLDKVFQYNYDYDGDESLTDEVMNYSNDRTYNTGYRYAMNSNSILGDTSVGDTNLNNAIRNDSNYLYSIGSDKTTETANIDSAASYNNDYTYDMSRANSFGDTSLGGIARYNTDTSYTYDMSSGNYFGGTEGNYSGLYETKYGDDNSNAMNTELQNNNHSLNMENNYDDTNMSSQIAGDVVDNIRNMVSNPKYEQDFINSIGDTLDNRIDSRQAAYGYNSNIENSVAGDTNTSSYASDMCDTNFAYDMATYNTLGDTNLGDVVDYMYDTSNINKPYNSNINDISSHDIEYQNHTSNVNNLGDTNLDNISGYNTSYMYDTSNTNVFGDSNFGDTRSFDTEYKYDCGMKSIVGNTNHENVISSEIGYEYDMSNKSINGNATSSYGSGYQYSYGYGDTDSVGDTATTYSDERIYDTDYSYSNAGYMDSENGVFEKLLSGLNSLFGSFTGIQLEFPINSHDGEVRAPQDTISVAGADEGLPAGLYGYDLDEKPLYVEGENGQNHESDAQSNDITGEEKGTEKKITLEITGSGAIGVGAGTDRDSILELIQENLRPVLEKLLRTEVFEEGNERYVF